MADHAAPGWAIGLMLLANLLFACVDTSTKWLLGAGLFALQLAFIRYFVHFLITVVDQHRVRGRHPALTRKQQGLVGLRAFFIVSATVANFFAIGQLPLSVSSAILNLSPVLVCLFSGFFFSERLKPAHWLAIGLGFLGVLIVIQPFGDAVNWYAVVMLYPATGMALYAILTQRLAGEVPAATMQFATGALGSLVLLPTAILFWHTPATPLEWFLYLAIGAFAWGGHELLTRAHSYASASFAMPFGYSFVIYLSLAGWVVFGNPPNGATILGAATIIVAGLMIWHLGPRKGAAQ